jgi:hypothetical protein
MAAPPPVRQRVKPVRQHVVLWGRRGQWEREGKGEAWRRVGGVVERRGGGEGGSRERERRAVAKRRAAERCEEPVCEGCEREAAGGM